jgi:predicted DNA-binding antitoxin AbrB/MazE fold protein
MARVVEALYEDGVFKPLEDPGLNERARVVLEIKDKVQEQQPERPKQRVFGSAKGLIKYMADDFDEPLEDFAEYM